MDYARKSVFPVSDLLLYTLGSAEILALIRSFFHSWRHLYDWTTMTEISTQCTA